MNQSDQRPFRIVHRFVIQIHGIWLAHTQTTRGGVDRCWDILVSVNHKHARFRGQDQRRVVWVCANQISRIWGVNPWTILKGLWSLWFTHVRGNFIVAWWGIVSVIYLVGNVSMLTTLPLGKSKTPCAIAKSFIWLKVTNYTPFESQRQELYFWVTILGDSFSRNHSNPTMISWSDRTMSQAEFLDCTKRHAPS